MGASVAITGANTNSALVLGGTADNWGTAKAAGAGDKLVAEIGTSFETQQLIKRALGSGRIMNSDIIRGRITPTLNLSLDAGFQNGSDKIMAQFFSTVSSAAEQNVGEGDYLHRFTLNPTPNQVWLTAAYEITDQDTIELPTCSVSDITTTFSETDELVQMQATLLGNDVILDSSVNDNATIAAATTADNECVIVRSDADFWLNTAAGALASGDQYDIVSYTRTLNRPQSFRGVVRGAAGNAEPVIDDLVTGTLQVTLQWLENNQPFLDWKAGTTAKCKLNIEGTQIGAGDNKTFAEYCPLMKLVEAPDYQVTEAGFNSVTLSFVLLVAAANPTGMNSIYPYTELINGRSTDYIV